MRVDCEAQSKTTFDDNPYDNLTAVVHSISMGTFIYMPTLQIRIFRPFKVAAVAEANCLIVPQTSTE